MKLILRFFLLFPISMLFGQTLVLDSLGIEGLKKTKEIYLRKLIQTEVGKPLDSLKMTEDITRIIREPAVSHAYYTVVFTTENHCRVLYSIEENKTLIPSVDLWSTLDKQFAFHLGVSEYNAFGRGYTTSGFYRRNIFSAYGIILENPNFITSSFELKFVGQRHKTLEPIREGSLESYYEFERKSAEVVFAHEWNIKNKTGLGFGGLGEIYQRNRGDMLSNAPEYFKTQKLLLSLFHNYEKIDYYYYFRNGIKNIFAFNFVSGNNFSNQKDFFSFDNSLLYYHRLGEKGNWAGRLNVGVSKNIITPFPVFFWDNNKNLRGVGNLTRRGNSLWTLNNEYRYTLLELRWLAVQGNAFFDVGGLSPVGDSFFKSFNRSNIAAFSGIGIRFIHKYIFKAVLRIDYGINIGGTPSKGLIFGVGQFF
jgi:outer membrane protein insertion porin family